MQVFDFQCILPVKDRFSLDLACFVYDLFPRKEIDCRSRRDCEENETEEARQGKTDTTGTTKNPG